MKLYDPKLEPLNKALNVLRSHGFDLSRMIAFSKSTYISKNPGHRVVFNANVFTDNGKAWWGDLDLTTDSEKLQAVADELGCGLYVLRESDGRYGNECRELEELKKLAVATFSGRPKQTTKAIQTCLLSLVSKATRFISAIRRR
jgi:hypothetical protein